jgi:hypothetical protein
MKQTIGMPYVEAVSNSPSGICNNALIEWIYIPGRLH